MVGPDPNSPTATISIDRSCGNVSDTDHYFAPMAFAADRLSSNAILKKGGAAPFFVR